MTGHFQGIQRLSNIGTDMYYAMTRNAWSGAFLIVIRVPQHGRGEIVTKLRLPSDGRGRPLKHPGGFQVVGDYAAICVEDARGKRRSQIQFFDVIRPAQPKQVTHLTLNRHGTNRGRKTAGAVGVWARGTDHLLVVGSWGSRTLDFYESNGKPLDDARCRFDYVGEWRSEGVTRSGWHPDQEWGNYQSLNLLTDTSDQPYLVAFHRQHGHDYADLYAVDLSGPIKLKKAWRHHVILKNRCTFQHAGGVYI